MGGAASVVDPSDKHKALLEAVLQLKPDLAGKGEDEVLRAIEEDIVLATKSREIMPKDRVVEKAKGHEESLEGCLTKLGHICRIVKDAEVSRKFYEEVLGARLLNRPKFPANGYWLWLGNVQLHLVQSDLVVTPDPADAGTKVNHISFDAYDFETCEKRLTDAGVEYKTVHVPEGSTGITQIFFQDPDEHWIELCDCHKMSDFIFGGEYHEDSATDFAKGYNEGIVWKTPFVATCILLLMSNLELESTPGKTNRNPARLYEVFKTYAGADDKVIPSEFHLMFKRMGYAVGDGSVKELMREIDVNQDESVTYQEFIRFLRKMILATPVEKLGAEIFSAIDPNASGAVTREEFLACMQGLLGPAAVTAEKASTVFESIDTNSSGRINEGECIGLVEQFLRNFMI